MATERSNLHKWRRMPKRKLAGTKFKFSPASPETEPRSEDLVTQFIQGNDSAFTLLYNRHIRGIRYFVFRIIKEKEASEDLAQETFIRIARAASRFDPTKKFSGWALSIARNLALNEMRNRSSQPAILEPYLWEDGSSKYELEDLKFRTDREVERDELGNLINETFESLPEYKQEILRLRFIEDRSYKEIEEITGCNLGTVRSRINRARIDFKKNFRSRIV